MPRYSIAILFFIKLTERKEVSQRVARFYFLSLYDITLFTSIVIYSISTERKEVALSINHKIFNKGANKNQRNIYI